MIFGVAEIVFINVILILMYHFLSKIFFSFLFNCVMRDLLVLNYSFNCSFYLSWAICWNWAILILFSLFVFHTQIEISVEKSTSFCTIMKIVFLNDNLFSLIIKHVHTKNAFWVCFYYTLPIVLIEYLIKFFIWECLFHLYKKSNTSWTYVRLYVSVNKIKILF